MQADPQHDEADLIVRALAGIPGGFQLNIIAKKFPRFGPAERGNGYEQEEHSFRTDGLPEQLPIPHGMDEFVITLQGVLADPESPVAVLAQVDDLLGKVRANTCWDSRTSFQNPSGAPHTYQVTVFSDVFGVVPGA